MPTEKVIQACVTKIIQGIQVPLFSVCRLTMAGNGVHMEGDPRNQRTNFVILKNQGLRNTRPEPEDNLAAIFDKHIRGETTSIADLFKYGNGEQHPVIPMLYCPERGLQWIEGEDPDEAFIMPASFQHDLDLEGPSMIRRDNEFEKLRMEQFQKDSQEITTRIQQSSRSDHDNRMQALMNVMGPEPCTASQSLWPSSVPASASNIPEDDKDTQEMNTRIMQLIQSYPEDKQPLVRKQMQNFTNKSD